MEKQYGPIQWQGRILIILGVLLVLLPLNIPIEGKLVAAGIVLIITGVFKLARAADVRGKGYPQWRLRDK